MKKFLVSLLLGSCVIASAWAGENYSVEIVPQPDQEWRFQKLMAYSADASTKVSGRLTSSLPMGLPRGHVDVAAYSQSGQLIAETTTDYVPSMLTHTMKKKGGVQFSAWEPGGRRTSGFPHGSREGGVQGGGQQVFRVGAGRAAYRAA